MDYGAVRKRGYTDNLPAETPDDEGRDVEDVEDVEDAEDAEGECRNLEDSRL